MEQNNFIKRLFNRRKSGEISVDLPRFSNKMVDIQSLKERIEIPLEDSKRRQEQEEKKKQMELLYDRMPFQQVEDTFKDELAHRLFAAGYERPDENALEDLMLDEREIEILKEINKEKKPNGRIDKQADEYLEKNIYSFVSKIKTMLEESERYNLKKPDIIETLNKVKKEKQEGISK